MIFREPCRAAGPFTRRMLVVRLCVGSSLELVRSFVAKLDDGAWAAEFQSEAARIETSTPCVCCYRLRNRKMGSEQPAAPTPRSRRTRGFNVGWPAIPAVADRAQ
jgi:hypothetical protein